MNSVTCFFRAFSASTPRSVTSLAVSRRRWRDRPVVLAMTFMRMKAPTPVSFPS